MEYKYKAFISYRHLEPDMQAAEKLQKLLEAYKPPKNLGKTKENWRIFRDVSELQSSSDLSEDIVNAIESSEYLIVICSPKYTESKWCMQELTRFRELHNNTNKNIITLLVSGDPHESFPEELTYTEMLTTNDKGEEVKVKVEVEPLAANITAPTTKESLKKLNTEYLRIAAPLLGCDFNDLYQRERRREIARRRRVFGTVSGILSVITIISVASAVTISNKNVKIKEQNNQIAQKNADLLVENAGHLAVESENLFKADSLIPAINKAVESLNKAVIPEAEYALSKELEVFNHDTILPQLALKHEYTIEQLSFMGGGRSIVSQDATGIYFWNPEDGKLIKKITSTDSEFASKTDASANKLTAYFDIDRDKTGTVFAAGGTPGRTTYENSTVFNRIYTTFVHNVIDEEPGTGGDVFIYNSDASLWRLDGATGKILWNTAPSDLAHYYYKVIINDNLIMRVFVDKKTMASGSTIQGSDLYIETISRETGAVIDTVKITELSKGSLTFFSDNTILSMDDNLLYVFSDRDSKLSVYENNDHALSLKNAVQFDSEKTNGIFTVYMKRPKDEPVIISNNILGVQTDTTIIRYSNDLTETRWQTTLPINYKDNSDVFYMPAAETGYEHDVLAIVTEASVSFIDYETGAVIKTLKFDQKSVDICYSRRGIIMFITNTGDEYILSLANYTSGDDSYNAAYKVQDLNTSISLCSYSRNHYVTTSSYSNTAYVRYEKSNPMYHNIDAGEYMYACNILATNSSGTNVAVSATYYPNGQYTDNTVKHLFVYDTKGQLTEIKDLENYTVFACEYLDDETLIVDATSKITSDDQFFIINTKDGSASKLSDAPSANLISLRFTKTNTGLYYLFNTSLDIAYISKDKKVSTFSGISNSMYAVSDTRLAYLSEDGALSVYSFEDEKNNKLSDIKLEVQRIFWQNQNTIGVFLSDRTVSFFDATNGQLKATVSLVGTGQEPISVIPIKNETFAVLCRDSKLYEMNFEGATGRNCHLEFNNEEENSIREYDSKSASKFNFIALSKDAYTMITWDNTIAWLLDTNKFAVRYRIDQYAAAPTNGENVFIKDNNCNKIGYFPIYSTEKLLDIANDYLKALGEANEK